MSDMERIVALLERNRDRSLTTYVDVLRELDGAHVRAQAALAGLESTGVVSWAGNGVVRLRGPR